MSKIKAPKREGTNFKSMKSFVGVITEKQFEAQVKDLEKLILIIKKGFQFLNTFRFSLQEQNMLHVRQSYQITGAVIILNSIKDDG